MTRIGDILVRSGVITQEQLEKALERQRKTGKRLGSVLVELGFITEEELLKFLSDRFRVPAMNVTEDQVDENVLSLIPRDMAQRHMILPIRREGRKLILGMVDPADLYAMEDVRFKTGFDVEPVVMSESNMIRLLDKFYPVSKEMKVVGEEEESIADDIDTLMEMEIAEEEEEEGELETLTVGEEVAVPSVDMRSAPVIHLVNKIITTAVKMGASDIHIEPFEKLLRVRFRVDGVLQEFISPPYTLAGAIVSRIKIMTGTMDIAERRKPQDGRIKMKVGNKVVDFRVSIVPTIFGEKVVMRILDKSALMLDLTQLGFSEKGLERFLEAIRQPYGIVLVTGPTGSGKSTTLYSALSNLNRPEVQIVTVEDPVEYNIEGINQVQVNEEIGFTFASALRAFLRQSPNIILVGEIRDSETADIAIRAALTGHLVLSTIHTNDAPSTVNRLVDMGIEPFLLSASLNLIQAQRLVRKVCKNCKKEVKYPPKVLQEAGIDPEVLEGATVYEGEGCNVCNYTGYKGRIAITEVMPITPELRELILRNATTDEIRKLAREQGMMTLREDAVEKMKQGLTTLEEVVSVTAAV